jgi:hypothetical protein
MNSEWPAPPTSMLAVVALGALRSFKHGGHEKGRRDPLRPFVVRILGAPGDHQ